MLKGIIIIITIIIIFLLMMMTIRPFEREVCEEEEEELCGEVEEQCGDVEEDCRSSDDDDNAKVYILVCVLCGHSMTNRSMMMMILMMIIHREVIIEKPRTVSREVCDQRTDDSVQVSQVL